MLDLFNVALECTSKTVACKGVLGEGGVPGNLVNIIHFIYLGIQIVVPILLILFGMIELAKAITAQKEDEVKKAQAGFLKKLIVAVIVFLTFAAVKFVFDFAGGEGKAWGCVDQLISGKCDAQATSGSGAPSSSVN